MDTICYFRKMYWSDWGSSPKIEQANMDGSTRTILVSSGLMGVNSLTLDFQGKLLYWCDARLDKIERVDLQGKNRVLILDLSLDFLHPFGLAISDDVLYWSDWNTKSINQFNMTSSLRKVVAGGMGRPMELEIYDHTKVFNGMHVYINSFPTKLSRNLILSGKGKCSCLHSIFMRPTYLLPTTNSRL